MRKLVGLLIVFVTLALAVSVGYYLFFRVQGVKIGIEFNVPGQVLVGQRFPLNISVSNYSDKIVGNAKLAILLPDGVAFAGQDPSQRREERTIGDLGPGSLTQSAFDDLIVLAGEQSLKKVEARLVYSLSGNASVQYQAQSETDIQIGQSAAGLSFAFPNQVFSGTNFDLAVTYQNNTDQDLKNVRLQLDYPPVFQFKKSSADAVQGNNIWDIGTLPKNTTGTITVTGSLTGPSQSTYNFHAALQAMIQGQTYTLTGQNAPVAVAASPLAISVMVNNNQNYVARLGDNLIYVLNYQNNSGVSLANVTLKATLVGEMLNFQSVQSSAAFDSLSNTFTWNTATNPELMSLPPGANGSVQISLNLLGAFNPRRLSDKNYVLRLDAQVQSPTVPPGTTADKTISLTRLETKVMGLATLAMKGYFRDAGSGILNTGLYPPKVNSPTRYTVHWLIKNYATDITGTQVSAYLQSGTRFTGTVKSTIDAQPTFNPNSGQVTWDVGNLNATQGALGKPIEAIFQIENTPAVNQVGQSIPLISDAQLAARDGFTGLVLNASASGINTDLPDDQTLPSDRRVQP